VEDPFFCGVVVERKEQKREWKQKIVFEEKHNLVAFARRDRCGIL
jgi:hypothetical protein